MFCKTFINHKKLHHLLKLKSISEKSLFWIANKKHVLILIDLTRFSVDGGWNRPYIYLLPQNISIFVVGAQRGTR